MRWFALVVVVAVATSGCLASADEPSAETGDDEIRTARKCETQFAAPLRAKVAKARAALEQAPSHYAAEVRAALDDGRVEVLPFCAMAPEHFEHFRSDVDLSAFGATPEEQRRHLRAGETSGMRSVHAQVYGYMWDDRVYVASNLNQALTLETLAHEIKHVMRRAHLRNFHDQRVTCVEELEAARAEVWIHKDEITPAEDRELRDRVHELYELDKLAPGTCSY